jgi:DHA2 family multidrug resistance protein
MMLYLGTVVLLPLLLQTRYGYTATWAGLASAPIGILPIFLTPLVGRYSSRTDIRYIIAAGFFVFSLTMLMRTGFSPDMGIKSIIVPQIIQGLALTLFFVPITSLAFIGLPPAKMAGASGLFNCLRALFGAIGASVVTTLWERREAFHHARLAGMVDEYSPMAREALERLSEAGLSYEQSLSFLERQISNQGFILAATEIYQLCAIAFMGMIALAFMARPKDKLKGYG